MGNAWKETLDGGDVLLIDGGMGTEHITALRHAFLS